MKKSDEEKVDLKRAGGAGDSDGMHNLGSLAHDEGDFASARTGWEQAAAAGDAETELLGRSSNPLAAIPDRHRPSESSTPSSTSTPTPPTADMGNTPTTTQNRLLPTPLTHKPVIARKLPLAERDPLTTRRCGWTSR